MSDLATHLLVVRDGEQRFAAADHQVQITPVETQQEVMGMPTSKVKLRKAPAFSRIKKLNLRPNSHVRTLLIEAGVEVQRQLEKRERTAKPLDNVLRAIVR